MTGWLVQQLPRALAQDEFTRRFVSIFEEIADGVRSQVDALEYYVDVDEAPSQFVRWMGSWLNVTVDAAQPEERQRAVVREAGRMYAQRGTPAGLQGLLEAITGGEVRIVDGGGVWRAGEAPPNPGRILVRLTSTGGVPDGQLYHLVAAEVPVGIRFDLRIEDRVITEPPPPEGLGDVLLEGARGS